METQNLPITKIHVIAMGRDRYWLVAVQKAMTSYYAGEIKTVNCPENLPNCIAYLPKPDSNTVLVIDSSGQSKVDLIVAQLRTDGWKYVIVVTADPSAKDAAAVLRRNLSYGYWEKTYDEAEIRTRITTCIKEITR